MPIALAVAPFLLFTFWRSGKKNAHYMGKGERVSLYILGSVIVAAAVFFQCRFALALLTEGGALPG